MTDVDYSKIYVYPKYLESNISNSKIKYCIVNIKSNFCKNSQKELKYDIV